ncbi:class I SAM-dependent methyltransferase [Paucisalibacillus globulus]|uniref:class I SAM-dependent methyltransferase n=1 Tax=Paucisalibacillus globulus TaxID=351095 RepID=UPI00040FE028|nr:class I SAM-dependent methyltransferase [Paucisalibacillus globulus]
MERIQKIRKEEKVYHDYCYENYRLFESGTWLHKPVKTVMDILPAFEDYESVNVLDLGSGVGRNSIPIAGWLRESGKTGQVVCVDLLDSAIEKLTRYSKEFDVTNIIHPIKSSIESFVIPESSYDLIVAVSSIEHVESEAALGTVLKNMAKGTKSGGITCIIINSEIQEIDMGTGEQLEVNVEVNISTQNMQRILQKEFSGWTETKSLVKLLKYKITRDHREVLMKTNAITYVVKKQG